MTPSSAPIHAWALKVELPPKRRGLRDFAGPPSERLSLRLLLSERLFKRCQDMTIFCLRYTVLRSVLCGGIGPPKKNTCATDSTTKSSLTPLGESSHEEGDKVLRRLPEGSDRSHGQRGVKGLPGHHRGAGCAPKRDGRDDGRGTRDFLLAGCGEVGRVGGQAACGAVVPEPYQKFLGIVPGANDIQYLLHGDEGCVFSPGFVTAAEQGCSIYSAANKARTGRRSSAVT